jgi:hypothetical protein
MDCRLYCSFPASCCTQINRDPTLRFRLFHAIVSTSGAALSGALLACLGDGAPIVASEGYTCL